MLASTVASRYTSDIEPEWRLPPTVKGDENVKTYRIAIYPGDGIGPEVVDAALEVIEAAERVVGGFHLDCDASTGAWFTTTVTDG